MKFVATLLLTLFCALLLAQTACAVGWRIHGDCSLEQGRDEHDDSCQWDPCRLSYNSPEKAKLDDPAPVPLTGAGIADDFQGDACTRPPYPPETPPGSSTPRPAGNFPLLI